MGPAEAIRATLSRYATFSGRARRPEYWWFTLAATIAGLVASAIDRAFGLWAEPLGTALSLGLLLPSLAVTWRRLHDTGRSGWRVALVAIGFVPLMAAVAIAAMQATVSEPLFNGLMIGGAALTGLATLHLLVLLLSPTQPGANRFGPEPPAA